jgi:hypothetical protein
MRTAIRVPLMVLLLLSCACPSPSPSESPSGGGTAPDIDPGAQPGGNPPAPTEPAAGAGGDRTLAVAASDPLYGRVEGTSFQNGCQSDGQCFVGGCSSEICSAEQGVSGTCDMPAAGFPSKGATCGCVSGQCVWYRAGGSGGSGAGTGSAAGSGSGSASGSGAGAASGAGTASGSGPGAGTGTASGSGGTGGAKPPKGGAGGGGGGAALPKQGEKCPDDKCAAGLTCKKYYGIAGARGPEFKTCEIPCTGKGSTCPAGQTCVTIADGPGQVCKPK